MKRPCEDSSSAESDMEEPIDVGSEDVMYPGHMKASFIRCGSPTTTTQVMARKKRRGVIEKRRRDRINNSLLELRRLVPTAFEKQGSAKLEKAEILQMTVDHLKLLQATGGKGYYDAQALALDFLSLGFRECVAEVCRYLGAVEGLDSSEPLRCRLLSHLASCCSQRDAAASSSSSHPPPHPHHHHLHLHQLHHLHHHHQAAPLQLQPAPLHPHHWAAAATAAALRQIPALPVPPDATADSTTSSSSSPSSSSSSSLVLPCGPAPLSASLLSLSASFPSFALHGGFPVFPPSSSFTSTSPPISSSSSSSSSSSLAPHSGSSSKPYRPWGTEVGAF